MVDFCSIKNKLFIEVDGSQHLSKDSSDKTRTAFLNDKGYRVLRFWNNQVMNDLNSVILVIMAALQEE